MRLQREADLTALAPIEPAKWPAFMNTRTKEAEARGLGLLEDFYNKSAESGYKQSHPYDLMFTGQGLAVDQVVLDNNYMKVIFGGQEGPLDNIQMAYDYTLRQIAESPIERDSLLSTMNPLAFVPVGEASKDSLLETFAKGRQFYAGAIDSDAERALKTRPDWRLISSTTYGKKLTASGESVRNNHVRGQNDLIYRPTDLENFRPYENLSSKTYAPDGNGGEVPLSATAVYDMDPRDIPVPGVDAAPEVVDEPDRTDFGLYYGQNADAFAPLPPAPAGFELLFDDDRRRF
jgi:hypothetical protein